jgi:hypothetical protein
MANIVKILWSKITGHVPSSLVDGQIAINQKDKKLFYPDENGVVQNYSLVHNPIVFTSIDFGTKPINEKIFNITDVNCTSTSKIEIGQYFLSQTEENFGVELELFTEPFNGNFNIIAISTEPFSRGSFNIKYSIL